MSLITITSKFDLRKFEGATKKAQAAGAMAMAKSVLDIANRYVPVGDTGNLQESGRIERRRGNPTVVYGGKTAWYALIVHEKKDVRYRRGRRRYLADALTERQKLLQAAAAGFKSEFR